MSNYCGECRFDVKKKTGPNACPFNALYWDFLARHRDKLGANPRLAPVYRTWGKMEEGRQRELRKSAAAFLQEL